METTAYENETVRIDHLGIVAGICKQIVLENIIDYSLPTPSNRKVSCGQATLAMVLNGLGLTGRALYLMPEYMSNKPVDILVGEGLTAADFNDDTLGRALDELFHAGVEGRISVIKRKYGLDRCRNRGQDGFERWVGWGVVANNLTAMGKGLSP